MKTIMTQIDQLDPAGYNPRTMPDSEMEALKLSIEKNGFIQPVICNSNPDRKNIIIGGHQRVTAAKAMGWTEVPVVFVDKTLEEEKALNLALNKIDGRWQDDKLAEIINDLKSSDLMAMTGFQDNETSKILDSIMDPFTIEDEEDDELPDEPISKAGEIYELGQHRLICGDATKKETYEQLIKGETIDMVFTDPPYNVNYHSRGKNLRNDKKANIENDNLSEEDFKSLIDNSFNNMFFHTKEGGAFYICTGWGSYPQFLSSMKQNGFQHSGVIVWVKNTPSMGWNDYRYKHEWIIKSKKGGEKKKAVGFIYGWKQGMKHQFFGDKGEFDVWEMPKKAVNKYLHPTEKPDWLPMRAIRNSTKRNDIILDPFAGSGSTMEAAEKTERRAFLIEYDPRFCDVIRKRYDRFAKNNNKNITQ